MRIYKEEFLSKEREWVESAAVHFDDYKGAWHCVGGFGLRHYTSQVPLESYKKLNSIPVDHFYFSEEDKKKLTEKRGVKYIPPHLRLQPWKYPVGSPEAKEALERGEELSKIYAEEFRESAEAEIKLLLEFEKKAWKVQGEIREKYKEKEKKLIENYKKKKQEEAG